MTRRNLLLLFLACLLLGIGKANAANDFARGADISWCTEQEADGVKFYNSAGAETDIFALMKEIGMTAIRLRVWVNPSSYGYGAWCDKADVLAKAQRANAQGLDLMIDFHYSDFFADPGTQTKPVDWSSYNTTAKVKTAITTHTTDVLQALADAGITPKWVQVGNETNQGMVWNTGKISNNDYSNYVTLSNAGYDAVKAIFPDAYVIVHLGGADAMSWFFPKFKAAGGKFDMIGISHYPTEDEWDSTSSSDTHSNINAATWVASAISNFDVPVMVCETGFDVSQPTLAKEVMQDLMTRMKAISQCAGVFYWEPQVNGNWKPSYYRSLGWNAYGLGAFSSSNKPTVALDPFAEESSSSYPSTLAIYDSAGSTVLATLTMTSDGIYTGQLEATTAWMNFQVVDVTNNVWYGTDPNDKTALSTDDGKYKFWIDSSTTGTYDITVNLTTMTWSHSLHQESGSSYPSTLTIYDSEGTTVLATLTATSDGVYDGQLEATSAWMNFCLVDTESNTWYKTDPSDKTSIVTDGWGFWIDSETTGTYDIHVDLTTMTWSHSLHVDVPDNDYWYITGDFNSWTLGSAAAFTQSAADEDVFTLENFTITSDALDEYGNFKFHVVSANWSENYVYNDNITSVGTYTLVAYVADETWDNIYCGTITPGMNYTFTWNRSNQQLTITEITTAATLAQLYTSGSTQTDYSLDGLTCVYATEGVLYCKDSDGSALQPSVIATGQIDYIKELTKLQTADYDQSNWVAVAIPDNLTDDAMLQYEGHALTDVVGTWTNSNGNGIFTAKRNPTPAAATSYTKNVYIACSFLGTQTAANGTTYFFVKPKAMEIAEITWAEWSEENNAFVVPEQTTSSNAAGLDGGFRINRSMLGTDFEPEDGKSYKFVAQIRKTATGNKIMRRVGGAAASVTDDYIVYPIEVMATDTEVVTTVNEVDVARDIDNVTYDLMGRRVLNPGPGIYIRNGKKVVVR